MQAEKMQPGWVVVMSTEMRRLWLGWRGPLLLTIFAVFLSVYIVLLAINPEMNVLSQRKMIDFTIQATVLVGIIAVLLLGADSFSGERDQRSLEHLLLTPVPRAQLVAGKLLAILSLWLGMLPLAVPYVILVASGTEVVLRSVGMLLLPGTILVVLCAGLGVFISSLAPNNLTSLAAAFGLALLLAAPTQLPGTVQDLPVVRWFVALNPFTAVANYQSAVIDGDPWTTGLALMLSPIIAMVLVVGLGPRYLNNRISLEGGRGS
jgi:ABC-2 type transport system permease protein